MSKGPMTAKNAQNNQVFAQYFNMVRRLSKSWVILCKIFVRVRVVHRRVRVVLCERLAIILTVYVVVRPCILDEVG